MNVQQVWKNTMNVNECANVHDDLPETYNVNTNTKSKDPYSVSKPEDRPKIKIKHRVDSLSMGKFTLAKLSAANEGPVPPLKSRSKSPSKVQAGLDYFRKLENIISKLPTQISHTNFEISHTTPSKRKLGARTPAGITSKSSDKFTQVEDNYGESPAKKQRGAGGQNN